MRLQSQVFIITSVIFSLHFVIGTYFEQDQIKKEVIANIKENARTIQVILTAYRTVYQTIFIDHQVPINDSTIQFLPAHAISRISKKFTQSVTNGLSFNTVSDRPRNPVNQADAIELEAIHFFHNNSNIKERFIRYDEFSKEDFYHFSQPIFIKPRCLKCHGKKEDAPKSIQQRYNTAYNYKVGDIRGLLSIKLPASIIEQRVTELFQRNLISHVLGLLLSFVVIAMLLNQTIISRIRDLKIGSETLAKGDYNTHITLSGNDEITQMGHEFNKMADMIAQREQQLIKQRSLYYALSQTNKSIVKMNSKEELLNNICHIVTQQEHIIFAWFGVADAQKDNLVAIANAHFQQNIHLSLQKEAECHVCPAVSAFLLQEKIIDNHFSMPSDHPSFYSEQSELDIHAVVSIPIIVDNQVNSIFSIYSDIEHYFSDDIVDLLDEIAHDIEYALKNFNLKEQHIDAQNKLEQSSEELKKLNNFMTLLLESTGEGIFGVDINEHCTFVNHAAQTMFGYSETELKNNSIHELTHHSYEDGSHFPTTKCPIHKAFHSGEPCQIDNEVFWHKDGTPFPVQYSAYPIRNEQQCITGSVTIFRDISERQAMNREMSYLASHDSLTLLLNRYSFEQRLMQALETAHFENVQHVVCYIDLDQFKIVNDTCGHLVGDNMLKMIANLLKDIINKDDTLARLGGDEFGLLINNASIEYALKITQKICQSIKEFRFIWEDNVFIAGCSIGIAAITEETHSVQSIMSIIDTACYIAKDKGRNQVHVSSVNDSATVKHQDEMQWVVEIRKALEENRFLLYQQEIISTDTLTHDCQHFEILLRMQDKANNIIPPGAFLPAAERYHLMSDLDRWVIRSTFEWLDNNQNSPQKKQPIRFCSINLSGQSMDDDDLYQYIIEQQTIHNIDPANICFEVTESAAITHLDQAIHFITKLKKQGFLFALDDFGTGMSSFAYLKNLPIDFLKIDGSFVKNIMDDSIDHAMVKSINDIGHIMGLKTIAEYVENEAIKDQLVTMNIDYLQGYHIAQPKPCLSQHLF